MSRDHIWMADFLSEGGTVVGFMSDMREANSAHWSAFVKTAGRGLPWPADDFPKTMWADDDWSDKRLAKERHIITGPAVPLVSEAIVEALSGIDISPSKFVPTDVFFLDRQRRTEKRYFQFHITPVLKAIVPEQSQNLRYDSMHRNYSVAAAKTDDVAVSRAAAGALAMWTAGETVSQHFFSDEVVQALKKAKLARPFHLTRCRLV